MKRTPSPQEVRQALPATLTFLEADRHLAEPLGEDSKVFTDRELSRVKSIVADELKGRASEDFIVKIAKRVLTNFAKAVWTRRSFWQQGLDSRTEGQRSGTRASGLLQELFDTAGAEMGRLDDGMYVADFEVEGKKYRITASPDTVYLRDGNEHECYDLHFRRTRVPGDTGAFPRSPSGVTGEGNAVKVFGHVLNALSRWTQEHDAQIVCFNAIEDSRMRLYDRLVQGFAQKLGWEPFSPEGRYEPGQYWLRRVRGQPAAQQEGRDDIGKLPGLNKDMRAYARLSGGIKALKKKVKLYTKVNAELTNPGMKNKFVSGVRPDTKVTHAPQFKPRK